MQRARPRRAASTKSPPGASDVLHLERPFAVKEIICSGRAPRPPAARLLSGRPHPRPVGARLARFAARLISSTLNQCAEGKPVMIRIRLHPVVAFCAGLALFFLALAAFEGIGRLVPIDGEFFSGVCFKALIVVLALLLMLVDRRRLRAFGFRASRSTWPDWLIGLAVGGLCGALGSAGVILSPAEGIPMIREYAFWQVIVGVWLVSSIAEEIFTRGLVQTWMTEGGTVRLGRLRITGRVIASGLLFGSMHLSIVHHGADAWTVLCIVAFTSVLGLVAAYYRERSGSLLLPIVIHIAGNVGGFIGAVITILLVTIVTGSAGFGGG